MGLGQAMASASPVQVVAPTARDACPTYASTSADDGSTFDGVALTPEQLAAATAVIAAGTESQASRRATRIALATALELSALNPAAVREDRAGLFQAVALREADRAVTAPADNGAGAARQFFADLVRVVPAHDADPRPDWEIAGQVTQGQVTRNALQWYGVSVALNDKFNPQLRIGVGAIRAAAPTAPEVRAGSAGLASVADWLPSIAVAAPRRLTTGIDIPALRSARAAFEPAAEESALVTEPASSPEAVVEETVETVEQPASPVETPTVPVPDQSTSPTTDEPAVTTEPSTTDEVPTTTEPSTPPSSGSNGGGSSETAPTTPITPTTPVVPTTPVGPTTPQTSAPTSPSGSGATTSPSAPTTGGSAGTPAPSTEPVAPVESGAPSEPVAEVDQVEPPVVDEVVPVPDTHEDPFHEQDAPPVDRGGAPAPIDCSPDPAGRSTSFDPGMIISDQVFYDTNSMTVDQVRAFIDARGAGCEGEWCLRNLSVDAVEIPADQYCKAFAGGKGLDAAEILVGLSAACGINPQVMLVTLQKESALVTRSSVTESSYAAAFGWHCPDSGPGGSANCDPAYSGFVQQTAGMAKQWSRYRVDPAKYRYQAGETAQILWNVVESGCGGSDVHIRNTATASLYNYTPYQPNAAAVATYPGVGDQCSTYGNRNFFFLFQKWFGTTGGGASAEVIRNGVAITIPSGPNVAAGAAGKVITAPNAEVARGLAAGLGAIGLPYVWGGGTAGGAADQGCVRGGGSSNSCKGVVGFDCSGLTMYVLGIAGYDIPDHSAAQRSAGTGVDFDAALPGDILGWPGHVAVYLGKIDGTPYLLEAPTVGKSVQVRPVYFTNGGLPIDAVMHRYWS